MNLCRSRVWEISRAGSLYIFQVSTISPWYFYISFFPNRKNWGFCQMQICARPACGILLVRGFGRYCKSQQPELDTSALYISLFPNRYKCDLCQMRIRARPGCGISIMRKDLEYIARINNHTLAPLNCVPLCLPTEISVIFVSRGTRGIFDSRRPVMTAEYQRSVEWELAIRGSDANRSTAEDQVDWGYIRGGWDNQLGSATKNRNQRNFLQTNTKYDSRIPGTVLGVDGSYLWGVEIKIETRGRILTEDDQVDW